MARTSQHGRRTPSMILFIVHPSRHPPTNNIDQAPGSGPPSSLGAGASLRIFTTFPCTSSSRLTCSPTVTPFITSGLTTGIDSLSPFPAVWTVMFRPVESIDSTVMSVSVVGASSSPRLIGPTRSDQDQYTGSWSSQTFSWLSFFDHSTRDRVLTPLNLSGKPYPTTLSPLLD